VSQTRTVLVVPRNLPTGRKESFFRTELRELVSREDAIWVCPARTEGAPDKRLIQGNEDSWIDRPSLIRNLRLLLELPGWRSAVTSLIQALRALDMRSRGRLLLSLPRVIAMAAEARKLGTRRVHALAANHPATVAMLVADAISAEFSFVCHRGDVIGEPLTLLRRKVERSVDIRCIAEVSRSLIVGRTPSAASKIRVNRIGVCCDAHPAPSVSEAKGEKRVLLAVGNLVPVKGHALLLESVAKVRSLGYDVETWLVGDGDERDRLVRIARDLGIASSVTFLGHLPHEEVLKLLGATPGLLFVHPSLHEGQTHEGIPISLVEAMCVGLEAVASDSGGIPELADESGLVTFQAGSSDALTEVLCGVLGRSDAERREARESARRRARALHCVTERAAEEAEALLRPYS